MQTASILEPEAVKVNPITSYRLVRAETLIGFIKDLRDDLQKQQFLDPALLNCSVTNEVLGWCETTLSNDETELEDVPEHSVVLSDEILSDVRIGVWQRGNREGRDHALAGERPLPIDDLALIAVDLTLHAEIKITASDLSAVQLDALCCEYGSAYFDARKEVVCR